MRRNNESTRGVSYSVIPFCNRENRGVTMRRNDSEGGKKIIAILKE